MGMKSLQEKIKMKFQKEDLSWQMSWQDFEAVCYDMLKGMFDNDRYRVVPQKGSTYEDGVTMRIDFKIVERRPGGKGYLIECKHYRGSPLKKHNVTKTADNRRRSRASGAALLISGASNKENANFRPTAEQEGIPVIQVHTTNRDWVNHIWRFFTVKRKLKGLMERT